VSFILRRDPLQQALVHQELGERGEPLVTTIVEGHHGNNAGAPGSACQPRAHVRAVA
jgi:hypothetical protein